MYKVRHDSPGDGLTVVKLTGGRLSVRDAVGEEKIHQIRQYSGNRYVTLQEAVAGDLVARTGITSKKPGDGIGEASDAPEAVILPTLRARVLFDSSIPSRQTIQIFSVLEAENPGMHTLWEEQLGQVSIRVVGQLQLEGRACEKG